jgi:site-specific recombinase XerD
MNILLQQLSDEINARGYSQKTLSAYLAANDHLIRYFDQPITAISDEALSAYFRHLSLDKKLSRATIALKLNAIHFLYTNVLHREFAIKVSWPKKQYKIPELMSRTEVQAIIQHCTPEKYRVMLSILYGCGLRISELLNLKVQDIDGERRTFKIRLGKGNKDRFVVIPPSLLDQLRRYWCHEHPRDWLFPTSLRGNYPISDSSLRKKLKATLQMTGINKRYSPHSFRHAYATHQLESGMPLHQLQHQLGHNNVRTTSRYLHWLPELSNQGRDLLAGWEV